MFCDSYDVSIVSKIVPYIAPSTLYRMQQNVKLFSLVRKPSSTIKRIGAPRKITLVIRKYLIELLSYRNDL